MAHDAAPRHELEAKRATLVARLSELERGSLDLRARLGELRGRVERQRSQRRDERAESTGRAAKDDPIARVAASLDALSFLAEGSASQRAALASLMLQQRLALGALAAASEEDKYAVLNALEERNFYESGAPRGEPCCPVDAAALPAEWPRVFREADAASAPTAAAAPRAAPAQQLLQCLETNRALYIESMAAPQSTAVDSDLMQNYGFSINPRPGFEYAFDEEDNESNIVFADSQDGVEQIKCATLNKLIERMTKEGKHDLNVRYTFLLTFPSFTTAHELLERLEARYHVPMPPNLTPAEMALQIESRIAPIQIKLLGVLKKWLEEHYDDFYEDDTLTAKLRRKIQNILDTCAGAWAEKSARSLLVLLDQLERGERRVVVEDGHFPRTKIAPSMPLREFSFMDCHPLEIARQVTLMDFEVFRQIKSREFLSLAWTRKNKQSRAPHIGLMIKRFNELNSWVQVQVLGAGSPQSRAGVVVKFLKIAKHCHSLNNFHSLYAIFSGLNANPIHRLRRTWAEVPEKQMARFRGFQELFRQDRNHHNFRQALQKSITPCLPHLGLFLADLTFIEEGNPDNLRGMINFYKRRMIAERIMWIKQYQQTAFRFAPVPVIQEFFKAQLREELVDPDGLWELSQKIEPRQQAA